VERFPSLKPLGTSTPDWVWQKAVEFAGDGVDSQATLVVVDDTAFERYMDGLAPGFQARGRLRFP